MTRSQNGYLANITALIKTYQITPKTAVRLRRGDCGWMLVDLARFIDVNIENIDARKDDWGYAPRNIRGSREVSNHASGTAIDINAISHGLGQSSTWTPEQKKRIHDKLKQYDGCIRWGEDYRGRKDGMHFEIDAPLRKVQATARRIRAERKAHAKK